MAELLSGRWRKALEDSLARRWTPSYLGLEQLLKHALALKSRADRREMHLVYCYWEPTNGGDLDEVVGHREEVAALVDRVGDAAPLLHATSYADLFEEWSKLSGPDWVDQHVQQLQARYVLPI
jgi:hypothetical protein